jgi:hypothetical protein
MRFVAQYTVVGRMPLFSQEVVRQEPTFERRPLEWVRRHGGPIACAFVDALPASHLNDGTLVTCHLSYYRSGWRYRARGQWHTHGEPKGESGADKYHPSRHAPVLAVLGSAALTRVCEGSFELPATRHEWDPLLRDLIDRGCVSERSVEEGALVQYGWGDFHRSPLATHDGWRVLCSAWHGHGELQQLLPTNRVDNYYAPKWPIDPEEAARFAPYQVTAPPHHPAPRHPIHSGYTLGVRIDESVSDERLSAETPLFAADPEFARRHGGPLTTAVLAALPEEGWRDNPNLMIDSYLNWLIPGRVPGFDLFHFEPFPGQYEGARALANWDETAEYFSCIFSDDAHTDFLVGPVGFTGDAATQEEMWRGCTNLERRNRFLLEEVGEDRLRIDPIPGFTLFHHRWAGFHRATPARRAAFHFRVRVSRGSTRPVCNAFRNFDSADLTRF